MRIAAIWSFIAGDSRRAPLAVALGIVVALVLLRTAAVPSALVGVVFALLVASGLAAAVFERA